MRIQKHKRHLVKGCLLLGGFSGQGRLRGDHALASGDILSMCLNVMDRRLSVAVWLHWLLLKVLEHLLKLTVPVMESERRVIGEGSKGVSTEIMQVKQLWTKAPTCWPCEDWNSCATAAKASEFCSWVADVVVEFAVTAVTGSLAGGGEEPERGHTDASNNSPSQ